MATMNVTIRMDEELKKQAVREQAIPFVISRNMPNQETVQAIEEIRELKKNSNKKTYSSFGELLKEVEADV